MTLLLQELPEDQQQRIAFDEQVLWCGKGRPVAWFNGAVGSCVMGLFVSVFVGFFSCLVLPDLFGGQASGGVQWHGAAILLVWFGFFIPLSLSLLFAPLWHWLGTRRAVWVITDRRVLRLRGKGCREWKDDELLEDPEWTFLDDGGRNFAFGQHRVSSKHGAHWEHDMIESVPAEDADRVKSALLRLAELRKRAKAEDLPHQVADVQGRFSVLHDSDGRVRIVYRKNRPFFGMVMLTVVFALAAGLVTLVVRAGGMPIPVCILLPLILVLSCTPFVYEIFGRREIALKGGRGHYFNGVGRIGISSSFAYDENTLFQKGRTDYEVNGRKHYALMLHPASGNVSQRILAHKEEAVVEAFIRLLSSAIQSMDIAPQKD